MATILCLLHAMFNWSEEELWRGKGGQNVKYTVCCVCFNGVMKKKNGKQKTSEKMQNVN